MLSAVPCIATLLELGPGTGSLDSLGCACPSAEGATGRVLLQNELSLAYWGKLTSKSHTGKHVATQSAWRLAPMDSSRGGAHAHEWSLVDVVSPRLMCDKTKIKVSAFHFKRL